MNKNLLLLLGLSISFCLCLFIDNGHSQSTEALYWFKKGVNETDPDKKIANYQKAIQESPNFVEAYYNLGLAYIIKKDYQKSEEALKKALDASTNTTSGAFRSNILNRLAIIYRKRGRYDEAEQAYQQALNVTNNSQLNAITLYELGQTKILQKQYDAAINYFRQGIRVAPADRAYFETGIQLAKNQQKVDTLFQQGMALMQNQKLSEAANIFNEIITLSPSHEEATKQLALVNSQLSDRQERQEQQIEPLYKQATIYMKAGNWTQAIKYLQQIRGIQPDYKDVNSLLSRAQENQYQQLLNEQKIENLYAQGVENLLGGNYTVALAHFEKVAELDPEYKDVKTQIQSVRREIRRASELSDRASNNLDGGLSEIPVQFDSYTSDAMNSQQIMAEKSRQMDAAIDSQLVKSYYESALGLMQKQEWQRAIVYLEKIKLIKPDYKNTEFFLNQVKQNIEKTNLVTKEVTSARSKSGNSLPLILAILASVVTLPVAILSISPATRAKYFILIRKYDKAREIYERMLSKKPNNIKLYITLANIYINENRMDELAIRVFERAIQYNDNLKIQLEPLVTRYYLQKAKSSSSPKNLIQGTLEEELQRMGN